MRTLELRLEDVQYETVNGWPQRRINLGTGEDARLAAALEFFDRALVQGMTGILNTRAVFETAAELTLLRFGVRIVGLEAPETGLEPTISPDPPQPADPEPIASQKGAEWPKWLLWDDRHPHISFQLVALPSLKAEIDRRWSEEPKLRERINGTAAASLPTLTTETELLPQERGGYTYIHAADDKRYLFRLTAMAGESAVELLRAAYNSGVGAGAEAIRKNLGVEP